MTLPSRKTLLANAVSLSALAWLYGGDLRDALRARDAEVSAFAQPPSLAGPAVVLALTALAVGVVGWGLSRRQGEGFKGYRLLPILLVVALMADLLLSESTGLFGSADLTAAAIRTFQDDAQELASPDAVPTDEATLRPLVERMGTAPYLVRGQPVGLFALQVRQGCDGPAREPQGARPGTLIYCVAKDAKTAWISAVGLPVGQRFGSVAMVAGGSVPHVGVVKAEQPVEPLSAEGEVPAELLPPGAVPLPGSLDSGVAAPSQVP